MIPPLRKDVAEACFEYLLRLGDDLLILGHRLSEWCGHAGILEEDLALANLALDCLGQANNCLALAGQIEGKGRTADDLAYFRDETAFRNCALVEQPNGDFATTIVRHFLFCTASFYLYEKLQESSFAPLAAIAKKSLKEIIYHHRHAREWMIRLGDGTPESHLRAQQALNELWMFTAELHQTDPLEAKLIQEGIAPDRAALVDKWKQTISQVLNEATLTIPPEGYMYSGARLGRHTEYLGHLLSEMQIVARSHPGAKW